PRRDAARRGSARGPLPGLEPADRLVLLLRHRYPEPARADRLLAHGRADSPLPPRGQPRPSLDGGAPLGRPATGPPLLPVLQRRLCGSLRRGDGQARDGASARERGRDGELGAPPGLTGLRGLPRIPRLSPVTVFGRAARASSLMFGEP